MLDRLGAASVGPHLGRKKKKNRGNRERLLPPVFRLRGARCSPRADYARPKWPGYPGGAQRRTTQVPSALNQSRNPVPVVEGPVPTAGVPVAGGPIRAEHSSRSDEHNGSAPGRAKRALSADPVPEVTNGPLVRHSTKPIKPEGQETRPASRVPPLRRRCCRRRQAGVNPPRGKPLTCAYVGSVDGVLMLRLDNRTTPVSSVGNLRARHRQELLVPGGRLRLPGLVVSGSPATCQPTSTATAPAWSSCPTNPSRPTGLNPRGRRSPSTARTWPSACVGSVAPPATRR